MYFPSEKWEIWKVFVDFVVGKVVISEMGAGWRISERSKHFPKIGIFKKSFLKKITIFFFKCVLFSLISATIIAGEDKSLKIKAE